MARISAKRGRKLLHNSFTVICPEWKKPNAITESRCRTAIGGRDLTDIINTV